MVSPKIVAVFAPANWSLYLVNNDDHAMSISQLDLCHDWLERHELYISNCLGCSEERVEVEGTACVRYLFLNR